MEVVQHGADWQDAVGVAHDGFDDVHAGHADGVVGSALAVDDLVGGVLDFLVDLLTMSEIIQCVADMRTQDMKAIREFGKFVPAFAAFEKNRLRLYRDAAKEAEEIFDRWTDEIDDLDENFMEDEDYEPDEYYSD